MLGQARGAMGVQTRSRFMGKSYDRYGMYFCPYVKELNIDVFYHTQIFITVLKLKKGTCQFDLTLDHEVWHHETNVRAVQDVLAKLKKELPQIIAYMERRYVPRSEMEKGFESLSTGLSNAIEIYGDHMYKEVQKRNTRSTRLRITSVNPNFATRPSLIKWCRESLCASCLRKSRGRPQRQRLNSAPPPAQ